MNKKYTCAVLALLAVTVFAGKITAGCGINAAVCTTSPFCDEKAANVGKPKVRGIDQGGDREKGGACGQSWFGNDCGNKMDAGDCAA